MRIACVSTVLSCVLITSAAIGQTTRPADELAKENAELKKRIESLERYVGELESKLRAAKPALPSPRAEVRPFTPAPYGYELPRLPFKLPPPVQAPKVPDVAPRTPDNVVPALPPQSAPEQWKRREFNGAEYYLVPLE